MAFVIVNGETKSAAEPVINAFDRGLTLGHGLFETMVSNKGVVDLLAFHWERLSRGCLLLAIPLPFNLDELKALIGELLQANQLQKEKAILRLTLTDGSFERGILANGSQKPTYILSVNRFGILPQTLRTTVVNTRRNENSLTAQIKSISYLDNILAKKEAVNGGFDEAILLNSQSQVAEGAVSNLFVVKNKVVYTPRIEDGALPGVIRQLLLQLLPQAGMVIKEQMLSIASLKEADELFMTNVVWQVIPVSQLDRQVWPAPYSFSTRIKELINAFSP